MMYTGLAFPLSFLAIFLPAEARKEGGSLRPTRPPKTGSCADAPVSGEVFGPQSVRTLNGSSTPDLPDRASRREGGWPSRFFGFLSCGLDVQRPVKVEPTDSWKTSLSSIPALSSVAA